VQATRQDQERIRAYVRDQTHEEVVHLEKAASELVGPARHDIWDVHCTSSRWWVLTNPTNLYPPGGLQEPRRCVDVPRRVDREAVIPQRSRCARCAGECSPSSRCVAPVGAGVRYL
jgi:hypothetical protein